MGGAKHAQAVVANAAKSKPNLVMEIFYGTVLGVFGKGPRLIHYLLCQEDAGKWFGKDWQASAGKSRLRGHAFEF